MDVCLRGLKESNKSRFVSNSVRKQCNDHIPYYLSGLSGAHFFPTAFLEIAVYMYCSYCHGLLYGEKTPHASVVQKVDIAIHRINRYQVDSEIVCFSNTYPLDSDLSMDSAIQRLNNPGLDSIAFTYHNMPNVLNMHPHTLFRLRPFVFHFLFQGS